MYELYKWSSKSANLAPKSIVQHQCPQHFFKTTVCLEISDFSHMLQNMQTHDSHSTHIGAYPGPQISTFSRYFTTISRLSPLIFPFVHLKKILQHTGMFLFILITTLFDVFLFFIPSYVSFRHIFSGGLYCHTFQNLL